MNVRDFLREVTPANVFDVIDHSVLINFLNGYSFVLDTGITVITPTDFPATMENLVRIDAREPDYRETFHALCASWRTPVWGEGEKACDHADRCVALEYFQGKRSTPRVYRCQPLGLWDMSYPLYIEEKIVGVILGGQIIVHERRIDWRSEMEGFDGIIDRNTFENPDNQFKEVLNRIWSNSISPEKQQELMDVLYRESDPNGDNVSVDGFKQRTNEFLKFGKITQDLLNELHKARKTAAEQRLLRYFSTTLADIDLTDQEQWWVQCGHLLNDLIAFPEIEEICLYERRRSRYLAEVPRPAESDNPDLILTSSIIRVFPVGRISPVPETLNTRLAPASPTKQHTPWGYRSETGSGHEVCSTLIIFRGTVTEENETLLTNLCDVFCTAADMASLIFREREADAKFRLTVGQIGHSFRTPLQLLLFLLEDLRKDPVVAASEN